MNSLGHSSLPARDRMQPARAALAAGGLLAAFGVASCCALPLALSMLGIGAASLVGIGYFAAQYQVELLALAVLCLAGVAVLSWRQWRARAAGTCAPQHSRLQAIAGPFSIVSVVIAIGLIALTFWIEPPL
ncbi:MAG TPA: hypothetical protein VFB13_12370 [Reyranella sp.]|jgi:mercuric ion transport protein|nr:hypothetical protein [Reyranella sp.]